MRKVTPVPVHIWHSTDTEQWGKGNWWNSGGLKGLVLGLTMFMLLLVFIPCLLPLSSGVIRQTIESLDPALQKEGKDSIQKNALHCTAREERAGLLPEKSERQTRIKRVGKRERDWESAGCDWR